MKRLVFLLIFLILNLSTVIAQEWQTDFEVAKQLASTESKPIVLVFQGSDWCAPCIKLDREIWSTDIFKEYSKDNFIMLKADFPRKKANSLPDAQTVENAKLAETYNKSGFFPFVVVLDANGKVLGETVYKKIAPEEYIQELISFINK